MNRRYKHAAQNHAIIARLKGTSPALAAPLLLEGVRGKPEDLAIRCLALAGILWEENPSTMGRYLDDLLSSLEHCHSVRGSRREQ